MYIYRISTTIFVKVVLRYPFNIGITGVLSFDNGTVNEGSMASRRLTEFDYKHELKSCDAASETVRATTV